MQMMIIAITMRASQNILVLFALTHTNKHSSRNTDGLDAGGHGETGYYEARLDGDSNETALFRGGGDFGFKTTHFFCTPVDPATIETNATDFVFDFTV